VAERTPAPGVVTTVLGPAEPDSLGIVDAHGHVWVEATPGAPVPSPALDEREPIQAELTAFRLAGGGAIVDCQPGGCGRNGNVLAELSRASGVALVACTGFHRRRYYAPDYGLWQLDATSAADAFIAELEHGLQETLPEPHPARDASAQTTGLSMTTGTTRLRTQTLTPVRAGFVKAACEATLAETPRSLLEGAARAARQTGAALAVHTERGEAAEEIVRFLAAEGVAPQQLILCHMDKRPDAGLHRELAQAGVLLEYDTFYRPKYDPEANLWPLIERMAAAGLDGAVALATDMAEPVLWAYGGGPGPAALPTSIRVRLQAMGLDPASIERMLGRNVALRLAGRVEPRSHQEVES
jgi:phosphotriesterase-related protein